MAEYALVLRTALVQSGKSGLGSLDTPSVKSATSQLHFSAPFRQLVPLLFIRILTDSPVTGKCHGHCELDDSFGVIWDSIPTNLL
jgi:hypothetical protein